MCLPCTEDLEKCAKCGKTGCCLEVEVSEHKQFSCRGSKQTGQHVCKGCLTEQEEHNEGYRPYLKCGGPVCNDVAQCTGCAHNAGKAKDIQEETGLALVALFQDTFNKETREREMAMRPFCTRGRAALPAVLLYVKELEDFLGLPLPKAQAKELIMLGQRTSDSGRNGEGGFAIVDASQLSINNPAWEAALEALIKRVGSELQLTGPLTKELRGLSIYATGCTHHKVRESDGETKLRLMITLSSLHQGGALMVRDGEQHIDCASSLSVSEGLVNYVPHFCAFYSECEQKLKVLTQVLRVWNDTITAHLELIIMTCKARRHGHVLPE